MEIEIEDYPRDDCMKKGRILILDIFENKFMQFLIIFFLIFNIILVIVQTYNFLSTFDSFNFILHGPLYIATSFIIVALVATLMFTSTVKKYLGTIKLWKINVNGRFYQRIINESNFITIYFVINTILGLFSGFLHMFPSKDEKHIFFAYDIFKQFPSIWEKTLSWIYRSGFILAGLVMPASCNQLVYFTTHIRYQIYILLNYLENLNKVCGDATELLLPNDENYQKEIKEKMIFVGQRYHVIKGINVTLSRRIKYFIILFSITGLALGISILIFVVKSQGNVEGNPLRIVILITAGATTAIAVIRAGQEIENTNDEIVKIFLNLKWNTWNQENKRIYLMLFSSISDPIRVKFSNEISVNFDLGLRLARALYSVMSVLGPPNNSRKYYDSDGLLTSF